jgi:hypothetical protein
LTGLLGCASSVVTIYGWLIGRTCKWGNNLWFIGFAQVR